MAFGSVCESCSCLLILAVFIDSTIIGLGVSRFGIILSTYRTSLLLICKFLSWDLMIAQLLGRNYALLVLANIAFIALTLPSKLHSTHLSYIATYLNSDYSNILVLIF